MSTEIRPVAIADLERIVEVDEQDLVIIGKVDGTKSMAIRYDKLLEKLQRKEEKGRPYGYAPLGEDGKVPEQYLPENIEGGQDTNLSTNNLEQTDQERVYSLAGGKSLQFYDHDKTLHIGGSSILKVSGLKHFGMGISQFLTLDPYQGMEIGMAEGGYSKLWIGDMNGQGTSVEIGLGKTNDLMLNFGEGFKIRAPWHGSIEVELDTESIKYLLGSSGDSNLANKDLEQTDYDRTYDLTNAGTLTFRQGDKEVVIGARDDGGMRSCLALRGLNRVNHSVNFLTVDYQGVIHQCDFDGVELFNNGHPVKKWGLVPDFRRLNLEEGIMAQDEGDTLRISVDRDYIKQMVEEVLNERGLV